MRPDILDVYLSAVVPRISSELSGTLHYEVAADVSRLYNEEFEIYASTKQFKVLKAPQEKLDYVGDYLFVDDFDFVKTFATLLSILFDKQISNLIDILTFKVNQNWRDFASCVAHIQDLETKIQSRGIFVEGVGLLQESGSTLELASNDQFVFRFDAEGASFKEGVLSLLTTAFKSNDFIENLMYFMLGESLEEEVVEDTLEEDITDTGTEEEDLSYE